MADDRSAKSVTGLPAPNAFGRPPRSPMTVPVRCRFPSFLEFVETQSVNVSREGMYLRCDTPPAVGTKIEFEVSLDDGYVILRGTGQVVRVVTIGDRGMGLRFLELDEKSRKLIDRIVQVNLDEGKRPTLPMDFSRPIPPPLPGGGAAPALSLPVSPSGPIAAPGLPRATGSAPVKAAPAPSAPVAAAPAPVVPAKPIQLADGKLRVVLSPATAHFFSYNPLLNIRMGGFFIPVEEEVPLGTTYKVEIVDAQNQPLISGKGKVVARQELRVGIRLSDVDKDALARLQALVSKLSSSK
ncbi:MAG TPA: PilZ domain-containing protein [Polyangia bacterium]|jgi:uncharacterized protein (TIGR02266 family)|nr:PilZ domain-containing protein [Polyangia bacterium]